MLNEEEKQVALNAWIELTKEGKTDTLPMTIFMMGFGAACEWHREKLIGVIKEDIAKIHSQMAGEYESNVISQIIKKPKI